MTQIGNQLSNLIMNPQTMEEIAEGEKSGDVLKHPKRKMSRQEK